MTSSHTLREVLDIVDLPRAAVMGLVAAGVVAPTRGNHGEYRFGFRDLVVLRTAVALRRKNVSAGRIKESVLRTASASLCKQERHAPARADDQAEAMSGQLHFRQSDATRLGEAVEHGRVDAYRQYEAGRLHERHARNADAEKAYRWALELDPTLHAAWVDLSALLCDRGDCGEALRVLVDARARFPRSTALLFNQAMALEDVGDCIGAQRAYQDCIALDPDNADAHFNLGRLYDCAGNAKDALRHYEQYQTITS